ncbi:MAG: hypothetical protein PHN69_00950 [Candidatus Pacebacteria bacterium]|nr:hypothetical protein [Candidatus Paceibacterota bacterium]
MGIWYRSFTGSSKKGENMASNKEISPIFGLAMSILLMILCTLLFFMINWKKDDKGHTQVSKPVTTAKVVAKTEVASRVVRDLCDTRDSNSNGPVTMKLDLGGMSFDLKNSK